MDKGTIKALNSEYVHLEVAEDGKVQVIIPYLSFVQEKITLLLNEVEAESALTLVQTAPNPSISISQDIKAVYAGMDTKGACETDVVEYLDLVAQEWTSSNKTKSGVTGSLIGKVSKKYSALNERLFKVAGSTLRDKWLIELIKENMPYIESVWAKNKGL